MIKFLPFLNFLHTDVLNSTLTFVRFVIIPLIQEAHFFNVLTLLGVDASEKLTRIRTIVGAKTEAECVTVAYELGADDLIVLAICQKRGIDLNNQK